MGSKSQPGRRIGCLAHTGWSPMVGLDNQRSLPGHSSIPSSSGSPGSAQPGICSPRILGFPVPSEVLEKPAQTQPRPPPTNSTWRKLEERDFRGDTTRLGIILCFSIPSPPRENEDFPKYQEIPLLGSTGRHLGLPGAPDQSHPFQPARGGMFGM